MIALSGLPRRNALPEGHCTHSASFASGVESGKLCGGQVRHDPSTGAHAPSSLQKRLTSPKSGEGQRTTDQWAGAVAGKKSVSEKVAGHLRGLAGTLEGTLEDD